VSEQRERTEIASTDLLDVLSASLARRLSVQDSPDIKHLVELPMTEAEYKLFIQFTSNADLTGNRKGE
jgi:hypothetical protein